MDASGSFKAMDVTAWAEADSGPLRLRSFIRFTTGTDELVCCGDFIMFSTISIMEKLDARTLKIYSTWTKNISKLNTASHKMLSQGPSSELQAGAQPHLPRVCSCG